MFGKRRWTTKRWKTSEAQFGMKYKVFYSKRDIPFNSFGCNL
jgi:hypothetical protein